MDVLNFAKRLVKFDIIQIHATNCVFVNFQFSIVGQARETSQTEARLVQ